MWTTKKRVEKLRYMHRNPVKRGLAISPEQWRWSSYRFYFLDEAGRVRVNEGWGKISFASRAVKKPLDADFLVAHLSQKARKDGAPTVLVVQATSKGWEPGRDQRQLWSRPYD